MFTHLINRIERWLDGGYRPKSPAERDDLGALRNSRPPIV